MKCIVLVRFMERLPRLYFSKLNLSELSSYGRLTLRKFSLAADFITAVSEICTWNSSVLEFDNFLPLLLHNWSNMSQVYELWSDGLLVDVCFSLMMLHCSCILKQYFSLPVTIHQFLSKAGVFQHRPMLDTCFLQGRFLFCASYYILWGR